MYDFKYNEELGFIQYVMMDDGELKWEIKKFHLDIGHTVDYPHVPKSVIKIYNNSFRSKMKREVNRIWRQNDFFEYCFDVNYLDAAYTYW